MKRMYSKEELVQFLKDNSEAIIEALNNKDISIAGLTSKGIANTGGLANIGDVVVSGDITAQGEGKGKVSANQVVIPDAESIVDPNGEPISFGGGTKLYKHAVYKGSTLQIIFLTPLSEAIDFSQAAFANIGKITNGIVVFPYGLKSISPNGATQIDVVYNTGTGTDSTNALDSSCTDNVIEY